MESQQKEKLGFKERLERVEELVQANGPLDWDPVGIDGNAFSIMGNWKRSARMQGWDRDSIEEVIELSKQGNYDELLSTFMATI